MDRKNYLRITLRQVMDIEAIRKYCLSQKAVTEEIKWEHLLCFCIAGKIFFALSIDDVPVTATFKVGNELFPGYVSRGIYEQAPYFARNQWVICSNIDAIADPEMRENIDISYRLVYERLPLKTRKEIGAA